MDMYLKSISMTSVAFVFLAFILIIFITKRKISEVTGRYYFALLVLTIIMTILELINPITMINRDKYELLNLIISKMYFCILITWGILFLIYIYVILFNDKYKKNGKKFTIVNIIGIVSAILANIIVIFSGIEYSGCVNNMPCVASGMVLYFIYICFFLGTIVILIFLNIYREKIKNINLIPTMIALLAFITILLLQIFTNNEINELSIYCVLIITVCYLTIESQDFKLLTLYKQSKKDAEIANNAKTLFLMKVSHEIRTPMNVIAGYSQALLNDSAISRESTINDIKNVSSACTSLTELIDTIIEMSKLEKGIVELKEDNYFLENIIFEINSVIPTKITIPECHLKIEVNPNLPKEYVGDAFKLFKIVEYMLLNTIKFTSAGDIRLSFDGNKKDDGQFELKINIIASSSKSILESTKTDFKSFIDNSISDENSLDNVRLGVIISKELVKTFNGSLEIFEDSQTTIRTQIILNQTAINGNIIGNIFDKIDINREEKLIDLTGKNILIVDDGEINLIMTRKSLSQFNANVTSARSGKECVELVKQYKFDLIFLDQYMPEMDGIATIKALNLTGYEIPPIVALTANTYDSLKNDYIRYGFSDYLHKPIIIKELNRILKKYFNN